MVHSLGAGHYIVFLGKTLYSQSAFFYPGVKEGSKVNAEEGG